MVNSTIPSDGTATTFDFRLYRYEPSLPAAIVSVAIFAVLTACHALRVYYFKAFYFTAFTIGGLCKSTTVHHLRASYR
jgi:hypothetical protein